MRRHIGTTSLLRKTEAANPRVLTVASTDQLDLGRATVAAPVPRLGQSCRLWKMFRPPLVAMAAYMGDRNVAPLPW